MELRGRAVSPWPTAPACTLLEFEARLLDSNVQGLLATEDLAGKEPVSGLQLHWATHTEFPSIVSVLDLNCCTIPLTPACGRGIFAVVLTLKL